MLLQFPGVVESIFNAIDEISREATKILHRPQEENGDDERVPNGGNSSSSTGTTGCADGEHQSLQAILFFCLEF
ncbi:unnamed protein product [Gongylonema pulchrum]|uniref:Uncharacterized protein n=1 Tax=Gongylonema pulchrum TaxID=637853 RepID=A0A183DK03_9BILA|nr:unnamed protein product [Gongylonema pulchrum]